MKSLIASLLVMGTLAVGAISYANDSTIEGEYEWLSKPNNIQIKMFITEDKFFSSKYGKGWKYRIVEEKENVTKLLVYEYNEPIGKQIIMEKQEDGSVFFYRETPSGEFSLIGIGKKK